MATRIFLALLIASGLAAGREKRSIGVREAVEIALEKNKSLHIAAMKVSALDARAGEATSARLPSLRLQAGYTRLSDVGPFEVSVPFYPSPITISPTVLNNYSSRLTLLQPLFTGFRLERSADMAGYARDAAQQDYVRERVDLAFSVKSAYWTLSRGVASKEVIDENVEQIKAHLHDVQNMLQQGLVTSNEVLKAEVQLSATEVAQIDASNAVSIATMNLNLLLGLPLETELEVERPVRHDPPLEDPGSLPVILQRALHERPDVSAAALRVESADVAVSSARGGWYPQVSLVGNYYYSRPNTRYLPTRDEFKESWDAGVLLSFDLWNWGSTRYQSEQAEAALSQARDALALLEDAAALDVHQSYLLLRQAGEKIEVAVRGVQQAEENQRIVTNEFKSGTATSTDVLDAEVALLGAKLNGTNALVEYEIARARLERAQGAER